MKKAYPKDIDAYDWDNTIVPRMNHNVIMAVAFVAAGLLIGFVALFSESEYLKGPYGWWPVLPFLGIFIFVGVSSDQRIHTLTVK